MEKIKEYNSNDSAQGFFWGVWAPQIFSILLVLLFTVCAAAVDITLEAFLDFKVVKYATLFVSQLAFVIFLIIYNKKMNIDFLSAIKIKRKVNIWIVLICILIGVTLVFLCAPFVNLFDFLLSKIGFTKSTELPIELNSVPALIFGLFAFAVVPAIVEEVMFRGMIANGLINGAKTNRKKILAVVLSGLIFAAIHLSLQQSIYPFVVGCVLSCMLLLTDNLVYTMIIHFVSNTIVVVTSYINYGVTEELSYTVLEGFGAFGLFLLALTIVAGLIVLCCVILKKQKANQSEQVVEIDCQDKQQEKQTQKESVKPLNSMVADIKKQLLQNKLLFNILAAASAAIFIIVDLISYIK